MTDTSDSQSTPSEIPHGIGFVMIHDLGGAMQGCAMAFFWVLIVLALVGLAVIRASEFGAIGIVIWLTICFILGFLLLRTAGRSNRLSKTPKRDILCHGVWFCQNQVLVGGMNLDLGVEISPSALLSQRSVRLVAVRPCEGTKTASINDVTLGMQIIELAQSHGMYRIGRLQVFAPSFTSETFDFLRCKRPMILLDDQVSSTFNVHLLKQIEALARYVDARRQNDTARCRIVISSRATGLTNGTVPAGLMYGAVGSLIEGVQGLSKEGDVREALQSGSFVNKETSELLLRMIEERAWQVEVRALTSNQLGMVGSEW